MAPMVEEEEIVIVGGGIAGLATALALCRVGLPARVLEQSPELRASGGALNLCPNAWFALRALGVDHKLTSVYHTMRTLIVDMETGYTQEFGGSKHSLKKDDVAMRTVHRMALLRALAEELPPDTIRFSSKLVSINSKTLKDSSKTTTLHLEDGTIIKAKVVIGCDGVHSIVAQWLGLSEPVRAGRSAIRGLSVFPEGHGFKMESRHYLLGDLRAAFFPLNCNEFHWFLIEKSSSGRYIPKVPEQILEEVTTNLAKDFPSDFLTVVRNTNLSTLTWVPLIFRIPWNIALGQLHSTNVTVAGDAMHPMTPEVGQGGCSALEDAVILARCLSQIPHRPNEALQKYVEQRRWRVAWIVVCSWFAGKVQHSGGTDKEWWSGAVRWFKDRVFYKFIFPWILNSMCFDCGDLIPAKKEALHGAGTSTIGTVTAAID